jgi:chromosome segregation ATPase
VARLEAVVRELTSGPGPIDGGEDAARAAAAEARAGQAETRLAELARRAAEADARAAEAEYRAAQSSAAVLEAQAAQAAQGGPVATAGDGARLREERDALASAVAERDTRIARLQREVADKTDRLGRLAKEMGELKAKGLGKIFR